MLVAVDAAPFSTTTTLSTMNTQPSATQHGVNGSYQASINRHLSPAIYLAGSAVRGFATSLSYS